ncbi:hypothetical protein LO762_06125 [Actinocorallia sp. API 0066]|uniref:hypothetical protein n=1 Tax=Actinocorallia sp. API 0066 TaxID=2896846 RepID=UPI001E44CADD|nr:hypothetical protein [Actinocorallia sp. API 0066]MCD0448773.1 hypothetical protein [Actinocorallia sp. API 0066]
MSNARHRDASAPPADGTAVLAESPFPGGLDDALAARPARPRPGPTLYLAAGLVAVAGFLGGVQAHQTWGGGTDAPTAVSEPSTGRPGGATTDFPGGAPREPGDPR